MKENSEVDFCDTCPENHQGLCPSILKILTQDGTLHSPKQFRLSAGQYLYHQGEQHLDFFILREGWILITINTEDGKRQIIRSVLSGDILGLQPDLHGPSIYSAVALQDSAICCIPGFLKMCSQNPQLALKLVWVEACEVTLAELYMANIAHRDAREKIAFMALELFQRLKFRGLNKDNTVPFPLNQEDIADTLGLTSIHVNRTLHKLQKENLLILHKHELTILDYEKLNALVGQELKSLKVCNILS